MFRFNPAAKAEGKNPFTLDSKEPTASYIDFIKSENRYARLVQSFPEKAEELFAKGEENAKAKYDRLKKMSALYE
jgi:pyruvate-ferredoxin/flavodoxin oxidoreductase